MNWGFTDFVLAAILLGGFLLAFFLLKKLVKQRKHKRIGFVIIALILLLFWLELSVGVLGTKWAGN